MNGGTLCIRTSDWKDTLSKVPFGPLKMETKTERLLVG